MKTQRTIAVIMIVGASVLTAWASKDIAFPALLCMLGLLGLHGRFTWNVPPQRRSLTPLLLLLLAILFAVHCRYVNVRSDEAAAFAWETIARYFLASMVLILFLRSRERLPPSLGLFQLAAVMAGGQVLLLDDQYLAFRLSELVSVTLAVLYAAAGRVADNGAAEENGDSQACRTCGGLKFQASHIVFLLLAVNVGWVAGSLLYRRVETLNLLPAWFWRGAIVLENVSDGVARVGFSTSGQLSSVLRIKEDQDTTPVLKITCNGNPGYLRARAFDQYRRSEWLDIPSADSIFPEQNTLFGMQVHLVGRTSLFRLNDRNAPRSMIVRHETTITDALFTPLGVSTIEAPFDSLQRDDDDILQAKSGRSNLGYRITYSTPGDASRPGSMQTHRLLDVPPQLDPRIRQLAGKIFAGCHTTSEKVDAVVAYFRTNYTYSLTMDIPPDGDKLMYFLLEASSGYCEYFASGAAILLRMADVPTRYVTGFLVTERGEQSNTWIARNMDAHAWVEAWDREKNEWTIVEATVQENLGEGALDDSWGHQRGRGALFLARFLQALYDYGLFGVLAWLFESHSLVTALSVSLAFLGAAVSLALWRRYRKRHSTPDWRAIRGPEFAALQKLRVTVDRKARAAGLRRGVNETLHAFAERLRLHGDEVAEVQHGGRMTKDAGQKARRVDMLSDGRPLTSGIAEWYLAYADLRYGRAIGPERVQRLQQFAQDLRRAR